MAIDKITTPAVTDDSVTLAKMAPGTDGQIITYDASGNPVAVGPGTDGQVLTSTGAGSPPAFETPASGTNTPTFSVYKNGDQGSISANTWTKVTTFTEIFDPQSTWDVSNNKFTPAVSGKYFIYLTMYVTLVDGSTSYLAIRKNGTQIIEIAFPSGRTTAGPIQLSAIVESDDNDYFEFYVKLPASNSTVFSNGIQTKCGGFKLIE